MLKQRLLTVALVLPLFLVALFLAPTLIWALLTGMASVIGVREWSKLAKMNALASTGLMAIFVLIAVGAYAMETKSTGLLGTGAGKVGYVVTILFWSIVVPLWLARRCQIKNQWLLGIAGIIVLFPLWHALLILHAKPWRLLALMAVVWVADTAAYTFGRLWGRRKLAPVISPGKTWEGALGAAVMVLLYVTAVVKLFPGEFVGLPTMLGLGVMMLILSIEGDLLESWLKRVAGVKDSGSLLPGHGGVLDRIDALSAALPIAVFVLWLLRDPFHL